MPRIKLNLNIGTKDCAALELDPGKAKEGATIDVDQDQFEALIKKGWGSDPGQDKPADPKPVPVDTAPPKKTEPPAK
jgi:hypothetical protein